MYEPLLRITPISIGHLDTRSVDTVAVPLNGSWNLFHLIHGVGVRSTDIIVSGHVRVSSPRSYGSTEELSIRCSWHSSNGVNASAMLTIDGVSETNCITRRYFGAIIPLERYGVTNSVSPIDGARSMPSIRSRCKICTLNCRMSNDVGLASSILRTNSTSNCGVYAINGLVSLPR